MAVAHSDICVHVYPPFNKIPPPLPFAKGECDLYPGTRLSSLPLNNFCVILASLAAADGLPQRLRLMRRYTGWKPAFLLAISDNFPIMLARRYPGPGMG